LGEAARVDLILRVGYYILMVISLAVKIDPVLRKLLSEAEGSNAPVEAVFHLRSPDESKLSSSENIEEIVRKLLARVAERVGIKETRCNIFRFLGSFAIAAEPRFITELLKQPEVSAAVANRQPVQGGSL
jgi:hypothetical protein